MIFVELTYKYHIWSHKVASLSLLCPNVLFIPFRRSCFPQTIIERVLLVGLKDYATEGRKQTALFMDTDDKMSKFKSVVDILGHLASHHSQDIKHAFLQLFKV